MHRLQKLYGKPLPANRTGVLYNAFPYPTKISPEAIALYVACHTKVGASILDPFSGSGTTGIAVKLCDQPTNGMLEMAKEMDVKPEWGKRYAVLQELSSLGAFVSQVMCNPPESEVFEKEAKNFVEEIDSELEGLYEVEDPNGKTGTLRYAIWSEILICPKCKTEVSYWNNCVKQNPLKISQDFKCQKCNHLDIVGNIERSMETVVDPILKTEVSKKKRIPVWYYGKTCKITWNRKVTDEDRQLSSQKLTAYKLGYVPNHIMNWGVLHRKGYHKGITHLHHFYTDKNLIVFSKLWAKTETYPAQLRSALKLLLLSYNASHSTLMSRVVVKKSTKNFVITGAQSGVLYISNLPVEKNIIDGLKRKIVTFTESFKLVEKSKSKVEVINASSTKLEIEDDTIDYVFTDPPFGDFIPYSEINQINEAWLGSLTLNQEEVIVNSSQQKGADEYARLMRKVLCEVYRVLKKDGSLSLVFHSAKAEIWRALVDAFQEAGFKVSLSSILDKVQASFKQATSSVKVLGDPLLLLNKSAKIFGHTSKSNRIDEDEIIRKVLNKAFNEQNSNEERKPERLFSRYITTCLETGTPVSINARQFYEIVQAETKEFQNT